MDPMKKIFRQKSLDKISSPERLDELMQVTSPRLWIALLTLGILLAFTLVWGVFGRIPQKVHGRGILIKTEGLYTVTTEGAGRVVEISVKPGESIETGQHIARVEDPNMQKLIKDGKANLARLQEVHNTLVEFNHREVKLKQESIDRQKVGLENTLDSLNRKASYLKEQLKTFDKLLEEGLVTTKTRQQTNLEILQVELQIEENHNKISNLVLAREEVESQSTQEIQQSQTQLETERRRLEEQELAYEREAAVVSPYSGNVLEVLVDQHQLVGVGNSVINLELTGQDLTVSFFIPDTEGKKVREGSVIQVSPTTVKKERYGVLLGEVVSISEFPATPVFMMHILQNKELVHEMAQTGDQFAGVASIQKDSNTPSGFRWSSAQGPPKQLYAGTICEVSVVTEETPPISLVIPFLRKLFGL